MTKWRPPDYMPDYLIPEGMDNKNDIARDAFEAGFDAAVKALRSKPLVTFKGGGHVEPVNIQFLNSDNAPGVFVFIPDDPA